MLAAAYPGPHSAPMANRNIFAIAGIGLFLMVGVVVALAFAATVFVLLYQLVAAALRGLFGIELPSLH
jgi:hypothetical protein